MTLDDFTPAMIVRAARHCLRPGASLEELENDAPRILAVAVRKGLLVEWRYQGPPGRRGATFSNRRPDYSTHLVPAYERFLERIASPDFWQAREDLIIEIWIDRQPVLQPC